MSGRGLSPTERAELEALIRRARPAEVAGALQVLEQADRRDVIVLAWGADVTRDLVSRFLTGRR